MELSGMTRPMTTPFRADGELQLELVKGQVDWLIAEGVHGLAAGGSTGEGHALDAAETRELLAATVEAAAGRVPVVAGIIVDFTREVIRCGLRVRDPLRRSTPGHAGPLSVPPRRRRDARAFPRGHRRDRPAGDHLQRGALGLADLAPALLVRIMTEVSEVIGVKQSAGDLKLMADLMPMAPPASRIFSAVDALLYPSFTLGAHGAIAAIPSAAPGPCVALWDAVAKGDHPRAHDLHRRLLPLWNAMLGDNLPACVRFAQGQQGVAAGHSRAPMPAASPSQRRAITAALEGLGLTADRAAGAIAPAALRRPARPCAAGSGARPRRPCSRPARARSRRRTP